MQDPVELAVYREQAVAWLSERLEPRDDATAAWGQGPDDVAVFRNLGEEDERALLEELAAWQRRKVEAGYGAIAWPRDVGGAGLTAAHERVFASAEQDFVTPGDHETLSVTVHLVAPTIDAFGTPAQRSRLVPPLLRADELCCQLFSEPGAGSDLASVSFRAARDGDAWILNGQKVWSSGARFAAWGELIARTDPIASRHAGLTAFIVPMDLPGIDVRPIRQMSGGSSFNEVFFDDVRVDEGSRLGPEGDGWKVALATLGFERARSGAGDAEIGGTPDQVIALARRVGLEESPVHRQRLAALWSDEWLRRDRRPRVGASDAGPSGSMGKLLWTERLTATSAVVSGLLGPRLAADTGEWGTFAWAEHVLGAPGYRIAGGSDEIQRNIIAERVLGLPRDPRP